jgi:hypothetical protein
MSSFLIFYEDNFLRVTIFDVANDKISMLLNNSFKRPLFLLYPIEFSLREIVG